MQKNMPLAIILLAILLTVGCTPANNSTGQPPAPESTRPPADDPSPNGVASAPLDIGKTEYIHRTSNNAELKQRFFDEVDKKQAVRWNFDVMTTEGDPIHHTLIYDPAQSLFTLTIDTRDDKFGQPSVTEKSCKQYKREADLLTDCTGEQKTFGLFGAPLVPLTEQSGLAFIKEHLAAYGDEVLTAAPVASIPYMKDYQPAENYFFYQATIKEEGKEQTVYFAIEKATWEVNRRAANE